MNSKSVLIILGIIILLVIGYFVFAGTDTNTDQPVAVPTSNTGAPASDTPAPSGSSSVTITYDGENFSPTNITVPVGTTVTWVNEGSGRMWVGSDNHPSHTHYDGTSTTEHCANGTATSPSVFDQCSAGASYNFTFTKAGSWPYHNHANSRAGGTVVVE